MNFPELADYACDDRYVRLIAINDEKEGVKKLGSRSLLLGVDMDPADVDSIKDLADTLSRLYDDRDRTDAYIQGIVEGTCYNMCALLGVPLAARMVSFVGGGGGGGEVYLTVLVHGAALWCREGDVQASGVGGKRGPSMRSSTSTRTSTHRPTGSTGRC